MHARHGCHFENGELGEAVHGAMCFDAERRSTCSAEATGRGLEK